MILKYSFLKAVISPFFPAEQMNLSKTDYIDIINYP